MLESLRHPDLDFEGQRRIHPLWRAPFGDVEAHVFENHACRKKSIVTHISAAQVHAQCKMGAVAAHIGVDHFEVGADAKAIDLPCATYHQGEVRRGEATCLVAIDIGLDHFAVAQELNPCVEIADILKRMRIARVAVSDVAQVVGDRKSRRLMHRVVAQGWIQVGVVEVVVVGRDIGPPQRRDSGRRAQVQEVVGMPTADLCSNQKRQVNKDDERQFLHKAKIGRICQTWECKNGGMVNLGLDLGAKLKFHGTVPTSLSQSAVNADSDPFWIWLYQSQGGLFEQTNLNLVAKSYPTISQSLISPPPKEPRFRAIFLACTQCVDRANSFVLHSGSKTSSFRILSSSQNRMRYLKLLFRIQLPNLFHDLVHIRKSEFAAKM